MRDENQSQLGQTSKDKANFQAGSCFFKTGREENKEKRCIISEFNSFFLLPLCKKNVRTFKNAQFIFPLKIVICNLEFEP